MSPQFCGTPMALPCIMEHAWCASSCLILFIRTQNFSTCPLLTCGKASGKNGNLHTIFHVSHTTTLGSGNIWYLIFEGNYFISAPCVSLCHHIRSTVLIFSSANGTRSMNRAMAIGQPKANTDSQGTAPLSSLALGNLETVQLQVLSC